MVPDASLEGALAGRKDRAIWIREHHHALEASGAVFGFNFFEFREHAFNVVSIAFLSRHRRRPSFDLTIKRVVRRNHSGPTTECVDLESRIIRETRQTSAFRVFDRFDGRVVDECRACFIRFGERIIEIG